MLASAYITKPTLCAKHHCPVETPNCLQPLILELLVGGEGEELEVGSPP